MTDQSVITFVLDNPNEAADELAKLRALKSWLIEMHTLALNKLLEPMPAGLDMLGTLGEYAERSGLGRGAISAVLDELQK
jgi:hypothetical protein